MGGPAVFPSFFWDIMGVAFVGWACPSATIFAAFFLFCF
jgi:hypothetical protein